MSSVSEIRLSDGRRFFVEIDDVDDSDALTFVSQGAARVPVGSEATGIKEDAIDAATLLRDHVSAVIDTVTSGLKENMPDEFSVEMNIGFKRKSSPMPILISGELNGSIKVQAKWIKG